MSSTSQLTTFSDIYTDLLQRVRVTTSVSASVEQAKRYVNIALHDIHLGFDYKLPWCERQSILRTKAPYSTGTVSISIGSTSLTGSSTLWNTSNGYAETNVEANGKFIFEGAQDIYPVSAASTDTACTLASRYVGSAALSGATYTYFEDEYDLASTFLRPVDFRMFSPLMGIELISRADFRRRYPAVRISGKPRVACIIDSPSTVAILTPVRRVVLYPYPDQVYQIPYTYITSTIAVTSAGAALTSMSSDSDEPTMPLRYRHAIIFHALYHWYRDKKDDARSEQAKAEYTDIMMRIVNDQDIATHMTAKMSPAGGGYQRATYRPYSLGAGSRVYDLNDEWDSFRR
jgi:hypothetical protein